MKMIILAAGQGTRLMPHTAEKPKCLVEYKKKPIIDYILETIDRTQIDHTVIVTGYRSDVLQQHLAHRKDIIYYLNNEFTQTNMVYSLFCAEDEMQNEDIVISYSDIIYTREVLDKLIASKDDISVVIDNNWEELWRLRMEDPLTDAETLKIDRSGKIVEIGKKAESFDHIQGQYIGLLKIKANALKIIRRLYHALDKEQVYDGKDVENIYMTSFLQLIAETHTVMPCFIKGGWIEIDSIQDLESLDNYSL